MGKNKSLTFIIFLLIVSILVAVFFQINFVKNTYHNKQIDMENDFLEALDNSLYEFKDTVIQNDEQFKALEEELTFNIIKGAHTIPDDNIDLEKDIALLKKEIVPSLLFNNEDIEKIKSIFKRNIKNKKLASNYNLNYFSSISYTKYKQIYKQADIIVGSNFGVFNISFKNKKSYLFSGIIYVILSSLVFIFTIILSGILLIKKYLNEKKLTAYKNEFINNLTHELQTPITVSSLALEKLKIELKGNSGLDKYISIAQRENDKMGKLSKRILKLAELKTTIFKKDRIDVSKSITQLINRYELMLNETDTLLTDFNHLDIKLCTDKEQFTDLLDNLISNAIKYSKSPRVIIIKTTVKNRKLWLSVKDNGTGIPKEFRDKIFIPFFKVPSEDIHEIKSHGLGLSYVAEIVKCVNGTISLSSEINKGTEFNIVLPYED